MKKLITIISVALGLAACTGNVPTTSDAPAVAEGIKGMPPQAPSPEVFAHTVCPVPVPSNNNCGDGCSIDSVITPWAGNPAVFGTSVSHQYRATQHSVLINMTQSSLWNDFGHVQSQQWISNWSPSPNPPSGHPVYILLRINDLSGVTKCARSAWLGWGA